MRFRANDLVEWLGGELVGDDVAVDGVSIDSRSVAAGNLFVPLVAERDGHDFVAAAVTNGAAAYLTSRGPVEGASAAAAIVVDDTEAALTEIGRLARSRLDGPVIGVTGSVGKTSVKDLIRAACGTARPTHASERSFNNELGVPLTLANAPDGTEVVVVEMGARGRGHIAKLCAIAEPTIGVVTKVALAHSELFGSLEGVAEAKSELVQALAADGTAILNGDDERVAAMAEVTEADVVTYGLGAHQVRVVDVTLDELLRPSFTLQTSEGDIDVALPVAGAHMALNAAGAVACALTVGVDLDQAVAGLTGAQLSPWRMEVLRAGNGLIVINDAYNANPTSMRAALRALVEAPAEDRVAVVGEMAELGPEGPGEHEAIAAEAAEAGIRLVAVAASAYGPSAIHVDDRAEALTVLGAELGEGIAVLVKGSRVAGLELLAADLIAANS